MLSASLTQVSFIQYNEALGLRKIRPRSLGLLSVYSKKSLVASPPGTDRPKQY